MVFIKYGGNNFKPPQQYFKPPQQQHQRPSRSQRPQSSFLKRMETQNPYLMQAITAKKPLLPPPPPQNTTQTVNQGASRSTVSSTSNGRRSDVPLLPRLTHFEQCETNILSKLLELRAFRVLHNSIRPNTSRCEFEVLEFYGDAVLYERVSSFLMSSRRFMSPHLLTSIRTEVVRNTNLARVYDTLQLKILIDEHEELTDEKDKADIVESIIGELSEASKNNSELSMQITTTLKNLLAFICFTGESQYFASLGKPKAPADPSKSKKKKPYRNKIGTPTAPALAPAQPLAGTPTTATTVNTPTTAAQPVVTSLQQSPPQAASLPAVTATTTQQERIQSMPIASVKEEEEEVVVVQAQVEPKLSPKGPISPPRSPMVFLTKTPSPPARTLTPDSTSYDDIAPLIEDIAQQKRDDLCSTPTDQATATTMPVIVEAAYNDLIEEVDLPGLQAILDFLSEETWWEANNSPPLQRRSRPTSPPTSTNNDDGLPTITQLTTTQLDSNNNNNNNNNNKLPSPVMASRYYKIAGKFYPVEMVSSLLLKEAENH